MKASTDVSFALKNLYYLENLLADMHTIETAQRGFVITSNSTFLDTYLDGLKSLDSNISYLKNLPLNNVHSEEERNELFKLIAEKRKHVKTIIDVRLTEIPDSAFTLISKGDGELIMKKIRAMVNSMESKDRELLQHSNQRSNEVAVNTKLVFAILAALFFIVLFSNYYTINRDLKKRRKQEKILKYNASLISGISDPIISLDLNDKIISWNKHAEELYGWTEDEVKGKNCLDVLQIEFLNENFGNIHSAVDKQGWWKGEMIHHGKSGKPLNIQCSLSELKDEYSNKTGLVAIMTDITARKRAEAKLREITANLEQQVQMKVAELNNVFERITDAFIALDNNWNYTYVNAKAAELHGKPQQELLGKNIWDIYPEVVNEEFYQALHEARRTMLPTKLQLYYSQTDQWFEDLIFPSPEGISVYYHDITKRKKAELQLQKAHEKLNYHINNTPMAVVEMDEYLNIIQWSTKAEQIFGWSAGEVQQAQLNTTKLMHPDDVDVVRSELQALMDSDEKFKVSQNRYIRKDGTAIYCEWYNSVLRDDAGRAVGVMALVQDITERTLTQLQLKEAEEKFRNLVEASMVGVYIIQDGRFEYVNPCFAEIFGYPIDHIRDKMGLLDMVLESDRHIVIENIRKRLSAEEKSINYEFRGVTSTGEIINVEVYGTRIHFKGRPAIIGMLINTTERKKAMLRLEESEKNLKISNERFMLVAKATNDAVWDWDITNDVIWGNEPFLNIFHGNTDEVIDYNAFISRIHPDDVAAMIKNHRDTLRQRKPYHTEEFRFRMVDGTYRTLYNRAYILYDEDNRAFRLLGAMQDITNETLAQKQLLLEKQLSDSIINSLPGVFYLYNEAGQFYRWNKNFETITGYTPREIAGLHPLDLIADEDKELVKERIQNVFKAGEDKVEAGLKLKNGEVIPYYFTGMQINYEGETCLMGVGIDISERVRSQQQLITSEENFRTLIEQASDGIFISDAKGDYKVVNRSASLLTGYSREELLTKNIRDLVDENDPTQEPLTFEDLEHGQIVITERELKRKDGSKIMIEISAKLLSDGRFQGIVRDITARKKSEEILRDSEEKRRLIMNAALDAIITIDKEGHITFWNPQAEKIFGWKAPEVFGRLLAEVIIPGRLQTEANRSMIGFLMNEESESFNNITELIAINRQAEEFPIELTVLPIFQKNESFFCVFIRDITERKKAEEEIRISEYKYRLLFEQNPLPMWMMSLPGKNFIDVNESAVEYYGYTKEEFLNMNIKDIRPDRKSDETSDFISTYKSGIHNTGIWQHQKKDGKLVKVNLITHDIIYQGRHAKLVLANDVTDKIEAEEKLKSSYAEIRELATHLQSVREAERTHMAREIHDELGQQLTGLKMDISWVMRKLNGADQEIVDKMTETVELIDTTVKTVRRIATQLRPSILDDLGIVAALEWQSEEFQKRSQIKSVFTSNVPSIDIPTELATGFFRIFQESLTNVLRHSKATQVETILLYKDNLVILNITDNGVGFDSSKIENKKTLGLLGMKERTLMMGGTYEITSKPGQGTKVVIVVPIHT